MECIILGPSHSDVKAFMLNLSQFVCVLAEIVGMKVKHLG